MGKFPRAGRGVDGSAAARWVGGVGGGGDAEGDAEGGKGGTKSSPGAVFVGAREREVEVMGIQSRGFFLGSIVEGAVGNWLRLKKESMRLVLVYL